MTEPVMTEAVDPALSPLRPPPLRELRHWRFGALLVIAGIVLGVLQAWAWAALAPGVPYKIYLDGTFAALPTGSWHVFAGVAIFVLLGLVVGVWQGVAAWKARGLRGTLTLLSVGLAAAAAALTAYLLGPLLAGGVDPSSVGAAEAESLITSPPVLVTITVILAQPLAALAIYTILSAWHADRGLETGLPQPPVRARS